MFSTIRTRFAATCKRCGRPIPVGTQIRYAGRGRAYHLSAECPGAVAPVAASDASEQFTREYQNDDTGRYAMGYRTYRDGSVREDFGSDR